MKYEKIRTVQREGGYEILFNLLYDDDSLCCGNLICPIGSEILDAPSEADLINTKILSFMIECDEPDKRYTEDEITLILRDKNYLTSEESFSEDMEAKG